MSIQRWTPDIYKCDYYGMKADDEGCYIHHDEHSEAVARLQAEHTAAMAAKDAENSRLQADVERLREALQEIADMAYRIEMNGGYLGNASGMVHIANQAAEGVKA